MPRFAGLPCSLLLPIALLAPLALLAFLALRTLGLEQEALKARYTGLIETRLDAMGGAVAAQLDLHGRNELQQARDIWLARGPEALRYFVLSNRVAFAMVFRDGRLVFPPDDSDHLLLHKHGGLRVFEDPARELRARLDRASGATSARLLPLSGGTHALLRCSGGTDLLDYCVVIEPAEVLAVLVSALGREVGVGEPGRERIWLVTPADQRTGDGPSLPRSQSVSRALGGLLAGWRIEAEDSHGALPRRSQTLAIFAVAGALIAGWAVLTWSLQRLATDKMQATERRARIIALLSHELRTPLANLRLYADLLQRRAAEPNAVARYAGVLDEEIARLEKIADNAIDLGRGAPSASRMEWSSPDDALRGLVDRFSPAMAAAGCEVHLESGAGAQCFYDRSAFERVIVNLLDNARKYAPRSSVSVTSSLRDGVLILSVCDDGPGISSELRDRIFEPLSRDVKSGVPGFGLGLSVVRALARQHGGAAVLEESSRGSAFRVTMLVGQEPRLSGARR